MSESDLVLDETKLSAENGDIYLFQWLCATEKTLNNMSVEELKAAQSTTEATLLKCINVTSPFPAPGRPIRSLVARCFLIIYSRGETLTMYDTVQACLKVAGDSKLSEKDGRLAALYVLGEIMAAHGSQLMSFAMEVALITTRALKSSSNSLLLRTHGLRAVARVIPTAGKALTDAATKDLMKQLKSCLTDKSMVLQREAAEVLLALHAHLNQLRSPPEIEQILGLCVKSFDTSDKPTRRALSRLIGSLLSSTQNPIARPPEPTKKSGQKKDQSGSDDDTPSHATTTNQVEVLSADTMLGLLATQFHKPSTHRRARVGIAECYSALFVTLGRTWVESHYSLIASHLLKLLDHPRLRTAGAIMPANHVRYERLLARQIVGALLRQRTLSERGQIAAVRILSADYLTKWPAVMPGSIAPTPDVLVACLREIAALLDQLGNAPPPVQEALADPLVALSAHPRHSVQVAAAWTLRAFCNAAPNRLAPTVTNVLEQLQKDVSGLGNPAAPADLGRRAVGKAKALAALLALAPTRPLYVSGELAAKVLDCAVSMLKKSGEHAVHIASVEVECAWGLISALTSLGGVFVRGHLASLLALWRNAIPKVSARDSANSGRSVEEWGFLLHVRGSAVGALAAFLESCGPHVATAGGLVTLDVGRRLTTLLSNALAFASAATTYFASLEMENQGTAAIGGIGLSLRDLESNLRTRALICFSLLGFAALSDSAQADLIKSTISIFAGPGVGNSMQAAIATAAGLSLSESADGYTWGLSSLAAETEEKNIDRDSVEEELNRLLTQPIVGSLEHNPLMLSSAMARGATWPQPPPPATAIVDAAIILFASLLPTQEHSSVYSNVQFLIESCRSPKLDRNAGRKAAVLVNTAVALTRTLRIATETGGRKARDNIGNPTVVAPLSELLQGAILSSDHVLRIAASEALGRLAALGSTNFLTSQVKYLVDQVVINRDPDGRAGCALAFGAIYSHVGGLAAGPLLKTTVNVLMSLGNDPHPVVHYYSLKGLAQVIDAASLSYSPHIASTLGSLCTIYLRDTHDPAGGSAHTSNLAGDLPAYEVICQIIDALIGVLGPELQEPSRTQSLVLDLVHEFSEERDEGIAVEAIKCSQHVLMFASGFVDTPALVDRLRANLVSTRRPLKLAAINGLYQLVQKDALLMSKVGGDKLVEDLFGMLDDDPTIDGVRDVILSWLHQTVTLNPSAWIDLCQRIMARTTASQQVATRTTVGLRDEESEGLGAAMGLEGEAASESSILTSRWRTQLFALQCLHDICNLIARSGRREHVDIPFAKLHGIPTNHLLITRVPDLIKMAFTASAAYVTEIRMEGLVVLKDVIQMFSKSPDPDYEESLLLEQHQAPITAALTPAFSSDSTPDVLASAIQCINLEPGLLSIGDVQQLGPNASVMLRVSTLTAWAELEIASAREEYLQAVLKPYRGTLALLWVSALRDYASIRADSEVQQDGVAGMDSAYTGLGRETLLPYYSESWSKILAAVGCEMKAGDPHILQAMDGIDPATTTINTSKVTRKDPTGCFFVILGLVYEALSNASSDSTATSETKATALTAIQVLAYLVRPEYAGQAILDQPIFDELVALWYRMTMTEPWSIQTYLVGMIASLAKSQHATVRQGSANGIELMGSETPIAQCLKACVMIIKNAIPSPQAQSNNIPQNPADRILLLISAFQALMAIGEVAGPATLPSVRALAISIYSDLLKDEYSEIDLVGPTLQSLRGMLLSDSKDVQKEPAYSKVVHGLLSACLQNVDDMSGRMGKASVLKTKNNLLAAVLILTVTPAEVKLSRAAVEHCCFLISQKLNEPVEISLAAAQCLKTLVTVSQSNPLLQYVASMLFPGAISFVVNCTGEDETGQVDCLPTLEEIFRAFTSFFSHVSEDNRPRVLGALMPPITCLLQAGEDKDGNLHRAAVSQLLTFASTAPTAFKEAAGLMKQEQRETMEASIRQAVVEQSKGNVQAATSKPSIALRSF
ncbi:HEAT repeat protein [Rhizoctonia solani]|uniref:HEAT repeat protein n=1 Tax=Rhizoctonia solani TaxID=456999 RepID=A0A8H8P6T2_9AGAM|nr:HEAT repeat protein [Rhizoctonia solani]QRW26225.1 HEAT repeat protein [Rhizoctonia solani]